MFSIDLQLVLDAQRLMASAPWSTELTIFFARWMILLDVALAILFVTSRQKKYRHAAYQALWSVGVTVLFVALIASVVQRPRPFAAEADIVSVIPPPINTAFPSGHTSAAVAIAAAFFLADPRIGFVASLIAALTAFGRVAAGVHYPTDILGGIFVGLAAFGIVRIVCHQLARRDIVRSAARHHHE